MVYKAALPVGSPLDFDPHNQEDQTLLPHFMSKELFYASERPSDLPRSHSRKKTEPGLVCSSGPHFRFAPLLSWSGGAASAGRSRDLGLNKQL